MIKGQYILTYRGALVSGEVKQITNMYGESQIEQKRNNKDSKYYVKITINDIVVESQLTEIKPICHLDDPFVLDSTGRILVELYEKPQQSAIMGKLKNAEDIKIAEGGFTFNKQLNGSVNYSFENDPEIRNRQIVLRDQLVLEGFTHKTWGFYVPKISGWLGHSELALFTFESNPDRKITPTHLGRSGPLSLSNYFRSYNEYQTRLAIRDDNQYVVHLRIHSIVGQVKYLHVYYETHGHYLPDYFFQNQPEEDPEPELDDCSSSEDDEKKPSPLKPPPISNNPIQPKFSTKLVNLIDL